MTLYEHRQLKQQNEQKAAKEAKKNRMSMGLAIISGSNACRRFFAAHQSSFLDAKAQSKQRRKDQAAKHIFLCAFASFAPLRPKKIDPKPPIRQSD